MVPTIATFGAYHGSPQATELGTPYVFLVPCFYWRAFLRKMALLRLLRRYSQKRKQYITQYNYSGYWWRPFYVYFIWHESPVVFFHAWCSATCVLRRVWIFMRNNYTVAEVKKTLLMRTLHFRFNSYDKSRDLDEFELPEKTGKDMGFRSFIKDFLVYVGISHHGTLQMC